jgi:hypothetical protein
VENRRFGYGSYGLHALVVMFKAIRDIGIMTFIIANGRILIRILLAIVLFFTFELIHSKWAAPELLLTPKTLRIITAIYTFAQLILVFWIVFSLKDFVWGQKAEKIVEARKSFNKLPSKLEDISDIDKFPKL